MGKKNAKPTYTFLKYVPILILQFLDFFGTILEPFVYLMGSLKPFKKSLNKKPKP